MITLFMFVVALGIIFGTYSLIKKFKSEKEIKVFKWVIYGIFCVVFSHRLFGQDKFFEVESLLNINGLWDSAGDFLPNKFVYWVLFVLRYLLMGACISIIVSGAFNLKSGKHVNAFIVPVIYLLCILNFEYMCKGFEDPTSKRAILKYVFFGIECMCGIMFGMLEYHTVKKEFGLKITKKEVWQMIGLFIGCCVAAECTSTIPNLTGNCFPIFEQFNLPHIILLILPIPVFIVLYLLLKNREEYTKWYSLTLIGVGLLIRHCSLYLFNDWSLLPLALCHTGCIIIPVAMATKNKALSNFALTNSILGALVALLIPTNVIGESFATNHGVHYISNHVLLIVIPFLASSIGVIPKCKFKDLKGVFVVNVFFLIAVTIANILLPDTSFYFFNSTELIGNLSGLFDMMPLRDGYVWEFSIFGIQTRVYYVYWLIMYAGTYLLTVVGFGFYKLVSLFGLIFKRKPKNHALNA